MAALRALALSTVTLIAWTSASYAGPCSKQIDRLQARIDARLEAQAAAGPSGHESTSARLSRQPTPASIARAEARLGEMSPQNFDAINQAMARARSADSAGDGGACKQALAEARRALGG